MERLPFPNSSECQVFRLRVDSRLRGSARLLAPIIASLAMLISPAISSTVKADGGNFATDESRVVRVYTQCGGEGYSDRTTVIVQEVRNPQGFNTAGLGEIAGQCGNRYTQPDSEVQDLAQVQFQQAHGNPVWLGTSDGRTFNYSRTYPQCGGSIGAMDFKLDHTVIFDEFVHAESGDKIYSWRDVGPQPGQCGN